MQLFKNKRSAKWQIRYVDEHGRRRDVSSGTTSRKVAEEYGAKLEREAHQVRTGLLAPEQLTLRAHGRRPLQEHLDDYASWCRSDGQAEDALRTKLRDVGNLATSTGCAYLADVTAARLVRHLDKLMSEGLAPRSLNRVRSNVRAFLNWCLHTGRMASHDLNKRTVPKRNEALDRRRKRRALTVDEERRLREASLLSGRWWTYQLVLWTGLRRGELAGLRWDDVDLEAGVLRVRAAVAKAKRDDELPLVDQALEALEHLRRLCPSGCGMVVPRVPAKETLYGDLERAGIQGRTSTGSCATNAAGERIDFHALRTTFATRLANAGMAPQVLKRLMRHANIATTDVHYVGLRTADLGAHLGRVAELAVEPAELAATGTDGGRPGPWTTSHKTSHNGGRKPRISADVGGRGGVGARAGATAETAGNSWRIGRQRTPADDHGLTSQNTGPVAQRPRAIDS
jgi:integrase/recombinase XerC